MKECVKEINKGNAIISHLQNEIRRQLSKNKLKVHQLQSMEQLHTSGKDEARRVRGGMAAKGANQVDGALQRVTDGD